MRGLNQARREAKERSWFRPQRAGAHQRDPARWQLFVLARWTERSWRSGDGEWSRIVGTRREVVEKNSNSPDEASIKMIF